MAHISVLTAPRRGGAGVQRLLQQGAQARPRPGAATQRSDRQLHSGPGALSVLAPLNPVGPRCRED